LRRREFLGEKRVLGEEDEERESKRERERERERERDGSDFGWEINLTDVVK
jgi:hypothetical protein